eukprot:CAMPEP_0203672050 /NCGR_PEP_ID=MMETSP0090-20130426/7668_1 /ASSEMBLY_ACC=CAM_ASM_001088 /TAXON_ID=426623 /ORGANISM="Chaetoceros affinis, Strain CCMP159" /LENGTH=45 /DNA_ID= /DNA_START= /DNA_END= /DNA_ORIENTATION=
MSLSDEGGGTSGALFTSDLDDLNIGTDDTHGDENGDENGDTSKPL